MSLLYKLRVGVLLNRLQRERDITVKNNTYDRMTDACLLKHYLRVRMSQLQCYIIFKNNALNLETKTHFCDNDFTFKGC